MSAPHRIAFLLPNLNGGGAERVTLNLIRSLNRDQFEPLLVVLDRSGPLAGDVPDDVPVHVCDTPRISRALPGLIRLFCKLEPAVIFSTFTHLNIPLLASKPFLKAPRIIAREANLPSLSLARLPWPAAYRIACRLLYPRADVVVSTSKRMYEEFIAMGIPSARIQILHNPVDEDRLRHNAQPLKRHDGDGVRFVAAGRLVRQKGFDRLPAAMAAMPKNSHCLILGDGPERAELESRINSLGLGERISFAGFVANPAPYVAGADAFLMPSRFEGMPNAALEALAVGTPVIATPEAGGIVELANIRIAEAGDEFIDEMHMVRASVPSVPRPSALPNCFAMPEVARKFSALLQNTIQGSEGKGRLPAKAV